MKISGIYLFMCVNFIAANVTHYRKCYESFSICLITKAHDPIYAKVYRYSRTTANNWCKDHSSSLAVITNENVQSAIEEFINDSSTTLGWDLVTNGYRYIESSQTWTNGISEGSYPSTQGDYFYQRYTYMIVYTYRSMQWSSFGVGTSQKKFICSFLKNNSSCPDGQIEWKRSCYKFHQQNVTWFDARNICLKEEGSDIATFDDAIGFLNSPNSERRRPGEYWIGLRTEIWAWMNSQTPDTDVKYSNWEDEKPNATGGDCLCVRVTTGKWTNCDCLQQYHFICIQDISNFQSTPTQMFDDNSTMNGDKTQSGVSSQSPSYAESQRLIIWVPLALLIVLIAVMAIVFFIVIKKLRKRNMLAKQGVSSTTNTRQPASSVDPYATVMPEYLTANDEYTELDAYETIGDENQENAK